MSKKYLSELAAVGVLIRDDSSAEVIRYRPGNLTVEALATLGKLPTVGGAGSQGSIDQRRVARRRLRDLGLDEERLAVLVPTKQGVGRTPRRDILTATFPRVSLAALKIVAEALVVDDPTELADVRVWDDDSLDAAREAIREAYPKLATAYAIYSGIAAGVRRLKLAATAPATAPAAAATAPATASPAE